MSYWEDNEEMQNEFFDNLNKREIIERTEITKKDMLIAHLDYATDKQIDFIIELLSMNEYPNKKDLLNLGGFDTSKTFDTATPIDYYRKIQELYPNFVNGNMIYDYSQKSFGEMLNANDLIVHRILKLKK